MKLLIICIIVQILALYGAMAERGFITLGGEWLAVPCVLGLWALYKNIKGAW